MNSSITKRRNNLRVGVIIALFSVFLIYLIFQGKINRIWISPIILCLFFGVTLLFILLSVLADEKRSIFNPLYLILACLFIGSFLRSIYIIFIDPELMLGFSMNEGSVYLWKALLFSGLGVFALVIGYNRKFGKTLAAKLPEIPTFTNKKRLFFVFLGFTIIGIISFIMYSQSVSGMSLKWPYVSVPRKGGNYLFQVLSRLTYIGSYLGIIFYGIYRQKRLLVILSVILSLGIAFISNSRSDILGILIVVTVLYHFLINRLIPRQIILLFTAVLILSVLMLGFREARITGAVDFGRVFVLKNIIIEILASRDFADINTFAHVIRQVEESKEILWGESYLRMIINFIPRGIWASKPKSFGLYVYDLFYEAYLGKADNGVPLSILGELYWNFHLPGLLIGMSVFGFIVRVANEYFLKNIGNAWSPLLYGLGMYYFFEETRVYFSIAFPRFMFLIIPTVFALVITARYKPRTTKRVQE